MVELGEGAGERNHRADDILGDPGFVAVGVGETDVRAESSRVDTIETGTRHLHETEAWRGRGHAILDAIDAAVSNFLLPTGGVLVALFLGWRVRQAVALGEADLTGKRIGLVWLWLLRLLVPVTILAILLQSASTL